MKCVKCNKTADISLKHLGGSLCASCFIEIIEKRVRKVLREYERLRPSDKIIILDDNTLNAKMCTYMLQSIFRGQPFTFSIKKGSISSAEKLAKRKIKVVIPWNMDDEVEQYLDALFNGKKIKKTRFIMPLLGISCEEIEYFAKIKGITGKSKAKTKLGRMLDELEKRYPGSKFGLLRSI